MDSPLLITDRVHAPREAAPENGDVAFGPDLRHECSYEEPREKGVSVSETASRPRDLDTHRPDRTGTIRHPLGNGRSAASGATCDVAATCQEGDPHDREVVAAPRSWRAAGLVIPHPKRDECVDQRSGRQRHADGNEIPSAANPGGTWLAVRRLAGVLVGRMEQTPNVLPGNAGEGRALKNEPGEGNAAERDDSAASGLTVTWTEGDSHDLRRRF